MNGNKNLLLGFVLSSLHYETLGLVFCGVCLEQLWYFAASFKPLFGGGASVRHKSAEPRSLKDGVGPSAASVCDTMRTERRCALLSSRSEAPFTGRAGTAAWVLAAAVLITARGAPLGLDPQVPTFCVWGLILFSTSS